MPDMEQGKTLCKVCNLVKPVDEFNIINLQDGALPIVCYSCEIRAEKRNKQQ